MPDLIPVDHDLFDVTPDHDPFAAARPPDGAQASSPPAMPAGYNYDPFASDLLAGAPVIASDAAVQKLGSTFPVRLARGAYDAFMLPGDVYSGRAQLDDPETLGRTLSAATFLAGGAPMGLRGMLGGAETQAVPSGLGDMLRGRENNALSLESRSLLMYDPLNKPLRPFEEDYPTKQWPSEPPINAQGNLASDIEGRPLDAQYVVGRRTLGGADQTLTPEELNTAATEGLGIGSSAVTRREIGGNFGEFALDRDWDTGNPTYNILVDKSLPPALKDRVFAHEFGHAVDYLSSRISQDGITKELRFVYNELNNPILAQQSSIRLKRISCGESFPPADMASSTVNKQRSVTGLVSLRVNRSQCMILQSNGFSRSKRIIRHLDGRKGPPVDGKGRLLQDMDG
ncbi:MAG: hypothetical protein ACHQAY_19590, partial [Hyphomicrobiales bacterium]